MSETLPAVTKAANLVEKYRSEHALVFVNDKELQTHPLFVAEVTLLKAAPEDFHNISGSFMPKSYIVDRIGEAAGINFIETACSTRKDGEWVYVGRSQGKKRLPDGTWRLSHVHEYEFDVETRAGLDFINDKKSKTPKYGSEVAQRQHMLEMKKFGRQRAGTGAHLKVIRELVGMPIGLKAGEVQNAQMVFSRVALNTEEMLANADTRQAAIRVALGARDEIFGPAPERNVTPEKPTLAIVADESEEPADNSGLPADDDIPWEKTELDPLTQIRAWFEEQKKNVPETTAAWITDLLDGKDGEDFGLLEKYKDALEKKMTGAPK